MSYLNHYNDLDNKQPKGSYALSDHNHDDRYYTESIIDEKITDINNAANDLYNEVHSYNLFRYRDLPEYTDLNWIVNYGMYSIRNATNSPTDNDWVNVLCLPFNANTDYIYHICISMGTTNIYTRRYTKEMGWSSWKLL